ncbi:class I SAM-dependent methyltransferase [Ramlibacter sp.]|uniref:class I SAM-dependent methyltransferase n=1 Tax=Ramlibacter sp. TaxID=1917967 RepID=UPI002D66C788|nr:class I SAM-dependent methyltransferase [Ramlibacter sp.]HYD74992.1 class I SAM-dependent methyltransferase [Ramlibacter sp.]
MNGHPGTRSVDACPACGGADFRRRVAIEEDGRRERLRRFSELKYGGLLDEWLEELRPEIVACDDCGHHWYRRQPSAAQLSRMYASGRPLVEAAVSREPTPDMLVEMQRLARMSGRRAPRLLDFGSGFGRWARAAARAGFRVHAYEPSAARGAETVEEFTLVHELAAIAGMQFEVVNLEQVLEHVPDPLETLRLVQGHFGPDTLLRVRVPNINRPPEGPGVWRDWPYDGRRVHIMAPFEHLHGFTPASLRALARRAGLAPVPRWRLARNYPVAWLRQAVEPVHPRWGSTFALLTSAGTPDREQHAH